MKIARKLTRLLSSRRGHDRPVDRADRTAVERIMRDGRPVTTEHVTTFIRNTAIH